MYYEIAIKHTVQKEDSVYRDVTTKFLVNNVDLFAEAEAKGAEEYKDLSWYDVNYIKRSPIREFVNELSNPCDKVFVSIVVDTYTDDNGNEKEQKYYVGLFASDMKNAQSIMDEYMKQGFTDMRIQQIKETKFENKIL